MAAAKRDRAAEVEDVSVLRTWRHKATGKSFQTATLPAQDGGFVSVVVEAPEVRSVGKTQHEAERQVIARILQKGEGRSIPFDDESPETDADDARFIREHQHGRFLGLEEFKRCHRL